MLFGCTPTTEETVYPDIQYTKVEYYKEKEKQALSFISMYNFMHRHHNIKKPSPELLAELNSYILGAGLVKECKKSCYLKYKNIKFYLYKDKIVINNNSIENTVFTAENATKYIYGI